MSPKEAAPSALSLRQPMLAQSAIFLSFGALGLFGSIAGSIVPGAQLIFGINLSQALVVQWIALVGVGVSSLPLARIMNETGAATMMRCGLGLSAVGCCAICAAVFPVAGRVPSFPALLLALLLLSVGATALQVSINPLALAVGNRESAPARLTLAQAVNSIGVFLGVHCAARMVLEPAGMAGGNGAAMAARGVTQVYLICAAVLMVVLVLTLPAFGRRQDVTSAEDDREPGPTIPAWRCRWAVTGSIAIMLYVGSEGAIGAIMAEYLHLPEILGISLATGGRYLANFYWGGAIFGRLAGSWALRHANSARLLLVVASGAAIACLTSAAGSGWPAGIAALAIGLCNSVMFPVIFAITIAQSEASKAAVSGQLVLSISGGALITVLVGLVGDHAGLRAAFVIPMCAYLLIAGFAALAARSSQINPRTIHERQSR